jgi:hypothetical protein
MVRREEREDRKREKRMKRMKRIETVGASARFNRAPFGATIGSLPRYTRRRAKELSPMPTVKPAAKLAAAHAAVARKPGLGL